MTNLPKVLGGIDVATLKTMPGDEIRFLYERLEEEIRQEKARAVLIDIVVESERDSQGRLQVVGKG